jgi:hypothetical protein
MALKFALAIIFACTIFSSCEKSFEATDTTAIENAIIMSDGDPDSLVLVDASRDGGVWWFPQGGNFSASAPHQGKALADYLRSKSFSVDELPRGAVITWNVLRKYKKIIRAGGFGNYTTGEIASYDSALLYSASILLLSDHLTNFPNDKLSQHLGLNFSGAHTGMLTPSSNHSITAGVNSLPYIAGSIIINPDPARMTILGHVEKTTTQPGYAAMGILHHPKARVFFIGDANAIEQLPQPFTNNLVQWLFEK